MAAPSGSQTVGPFFSFALNHDHWNDLTAASPPGEKIRIVGRLLDGDGGPIADGFVEIRQADAAGSYAGGDFIGFGRCASDVDGIYSFLTIRPGAVPSAHGLQAPHIAVSIFARGLLRQLMTRMYFSDRAAQNTGDPLLKTIPETRARTLIAQRVAGARGVPEFRFDIVLQGKGETAFFEP
jgi:protocatechuate 3,4-dioxygenase alpha subunit